MHDIAHGSQYTQTFTACQLCILFTTCCVVNMTYSLRVRWTRSLPTSRRTRNRHPQPRTPANLTEIAPWRKHTNHHRRPQPSPLPSSRTKPQPPRPVILSERSEPKNPAPTNPHAGRPAHADASASMPDPPSCAGIGGHPPAQRRAIVTSNASESSSYDNPGSSQTSISDPDQNDLSAFLSADLRRTGKFLLSPPK